MTSDVFAEWIKRKSVTVAADPASTTDAELAPLLDWIGSSRVVALGESMHRTHEFLAWRHRIFRFLVEHAGFTALVLESGFVEGATVDRWVSHGEGRLRHALDEGITYHFGKCQESLDLLTWMRERNVSGAPPVRFYGMDLPDSAASALPAIVAVHEFLQTADPYYAAHIDDTLLTAHGFLPDDRSGLARAAPAIQAYLALDQGTRDAITARISGLVERIRARQTDYLQQGVDAAEAAKVLRAAEVARGADAFLAAMIDGPTRTWPGANIRDVTMADTVEWILAREERVLVFAANGHIRKTPYLAPPFVPAPLATVGTHLHARLGTDYTVIGTTFGGGEAWLHRPRPEDPPGHSTPFVEPVGTLRTESLDRRFADARHGSFLLDLGSAPPTVSGVFEQILGTHNGPELELADVRGSYDVMLHVDRVTPWHTWIDARGHWS